jgi:hypothetical protein
MRVKYRCHDWLQVDFCSSTRIHEDQEGISAVTSYQMEIPVDFVDTENAVCRGCERPAHNCLIV